MCIRHRCMRSTHNHVGNGMMLKNVIGKLVAATAVGAVLLSVGSHARADAAGEKVLHQVDEAQNQYETLTLKYTMTTKEPGRDESHLIVRTNFKGHKQFTELLGPPDMKGTKVLHLSNTKMYIYLPSYRKVRRVQSHMTEAGFLGTTYSQRDMNMTRFRPYFSADIEGEDNATWTLRLTARPDKRAPYGKIEMTVDKAKNLPLRMKYFNDKGAHVKTETRMKYFCEGKVCLAKRQKMVDHTKSDKWSKLKLDEWDINPSLPDKMFSKRNLK